MGKKAKRKQAATMNQMNTMVQGQVDEFKGQQQVAQDRADKTRAQYEAFEFTNPFAGSQNAFGGIQTEFDNLAGGLTNVTDGFTNVAADARDVSEGMTNYAADARNTFAGAQNTFAGMDNAYAGLENKYEGMENRFEDMTVDMRAADFQAQQGGQQRANIMQGLRGAAGSSGVAGLAQAMANQGSMQAQQQAAGIGQQERQNQMLSAQEGSRIDQMQRGAGMQLQQLEAGGAMSVQQAERAGAMQQQNMRMAGAAQQQNLQMQGAADLQGKQFAGAAAQQAAQLQGAQTLQSQQIQGAQNLQNQQLQGAINAQNLGVSQGNIMAQGQQYADTQIMQGAGAVQAAQAGQQATLLGMDYGSLAGANAAYQGALGNQMSGMGMTADMYGSQAANNPFSQVLSAGAQIGSAYLMSDRRLKKNINKIGESPSGLNIYSFEYKNSKYGQGLFQGVMSDEIPQEAVVQMDNGYDAVNYSMLDVEFKQI